MKYRLVLGLIIGLLMAAGPASPSSKPIRAAQSDPASEIFQLVNNFRISLGLPPFQYNSTLAIAAQNQANWMAANVVYSHTGEGGSTPQTRAAAVGYTGYVVENIVGGGNMSPRQGLIWWQNSQVHYNTLTSTRYVEAGTAFASNGVQNMYVIVVGQGAGTVITAPTGSEPDSSAEPLIITPIELAKPREDGSIVHLLQQGQALWTIAAYYDVELDHLYLINGLSPGDVVYVNDEVMVRLAEGQTPPPTPTPSPTHIIREGESAWSIANQYGISLDTFYSLNGLTEGAVLQPGDEVFVRLAEGQSPPPTPTPRTTHTIRQGESLWAIAAIYDLTVDQLLAFNDLVVAPILRIGDELRIIPLAPTAEAPATMPPPAETAATPDSIPPIPTPEDSGAVSPGSNPSPPPMTTAEGMAAPADSAILESGDIRNAVPEDTGQDAGTVIVVIVFGLLVAGGILLIAAGRRPG
jgi:LysM repeat protein